jgi:hypothetical protein
MVVIPIPLTGNETWGDLNDATTITRLNVQQRADTLELALVDSYQQHQSLPRTQSWDQWQAPLTQIVSISENRESL